MVNFLLLLLKFPFTVYLNFLLLFKVFKVLKSEDFSCENRCFFKIFDFNLNIFSS